MNKSRIESFIILAVLSLIWGSSFILMKKGLLAFDAVQVASLRIIFAGLVFVPFIIKNFRKIPWNKYGYIILFALLEVGIPPYLYTFAQTHVDSSSAGILNSLVPLFTLIAGFFFFRLRFHWVITAGVLTGLIGALLLTFFKMQGNHGASFDLGNSWGLLIVLATFLYGMASNIIKEHLYNVSSSMLTAVAFVSLSVPAALILLTTNIFSVPFTNTVHIHALIAIIILSVFGSALAILIFSKLIHLSNALFASFVTYFIPFVSLLWGWLDNEKISPIHFSSLLVIFLGIYIANLGEKLQQNKNNLQ